MSDYCCKTCRFWKVREEAGTVGECLALPPAAPQSNDFYGKFPGTRDDWVCGEWRSKAQDKNVAAMGAAKMAAAQAIKWLD